MAAFIEEIVHQAMRPAAALARLPATLAHRAWAQVLWGIGMGPLPRRLYPLITKMHYFPLGVQSPSRPPYEPRYAIDGVHPSTTWWPQLYTGLYYLNHPPRSTMCMK